MPAFLYLVENMNIANEHVTPLLSYNVNQKLTKKRLRHYRSLEDIGKERYDIKPTEEEFEELFKPLFLLSRELNITAKCLANEGYIVSVMRNYVTCFLSVISSYHDDEDLRSF